MKAASTILFLLLAASVAADGPDGMPKIHLEALGMAVDLPVSAQWTSAIRHIGKIPDDLLSRTDANGRRQDIWVSGFKDRTCAGWAEFTQSEGGTDTTVHTGLRFAGWHDPMLDIQNGRNTVACLDIRDGMIVTMFAGPAFDTPAEHREELVKALEGLRQAASARSSPAAPD